MVSFHNNVKAEAIAAARLPTTCLACGSMSSCTARLKHTPFFCNTNWLRYALQEDMQLIDMDGQWGGGTGNKLALSRSRTPHWPVSGCCAAGGPAQVVIPCLVILLTVEFRECTLRLSRTQTARRLCACTLNLNAPRASWRCRGICTSAIPWRPRLCTINQVVVRYTNL